MVWLCRAAVVPPILPVFARTVEILNDSLPSRLIAAGILAAFACMGVVLLLLEKRKSDRREKTEKGE